MPGIAELLEKLQLTGHARLGKLRLTLEHRNCGRCRRCAEASDRPHGPYIYARDQWGHRRYMGTTKQPSPKLLATLATVDVDHADTPNP